MKKVFALMLIAAVAFAIAAPSFAAKVVVTKTVVTKTVTMVSARPHMNAAMAKLVDAQKQLDLAATDYGGHRVKAMAAVKTAMDEINQAFAYANANPGK
ncbi:MAG TPA: hypothetical protein VMD02_04295 [Candidatus Omnitrophota bacterium]|nr:hypothetical protein [Candidatus Omnitrophota bacterium]